MTVACLKLEEFANHFGGLLCGYRPEHDLAKLGKR